jgi:Tfp pilus assembly protein PilE
MNALGVIIGATKMLITPRQSGITLLELLIVLAVVFVILYIALPTLRPSEEEATIARAKEHLLYLHAREEKYYTVHGEYAPFSEIAKDPAVGVGFDKRFERDDAQVDGIDFSGPKSKGRIFDIVAKLPNGTRYRIDQTGVITSMQGI